MRLSTQISLVFLLVAVVPLTGMTLYSYAGSQRAYRGVVEVEARRVAEELSQQLDAAGDALSAQFERRRSRKVEGASSAFQRARQEALAGAQEAELSALLESLLSSARGDQGRIPFAVDLGGELHAAQPADLPRLRALGLGASQGGASPGVDAHDWVVVMRKDPETGVTIGVAHPLEHALKDLRRTAAWNLGLGLAIVAVALGAILPLSRRLTRHLDSLTAGVERLAEGQSEVQVPVPHGYELRRLALTFNQMAADLQRQQQRLLEQERLRKELEISRRIQEELLPRQAASFPFGEAAGLSIPAREVGGDFFNYFALSAGEAAVLIGDVSGKGVPAAILMANLQATLQARLPLDSDLARLAARMDQELGSGEAGALYLTLFIAVVDGQSLRYVNAGHATQMLVRAAGGLERLESTGRPLGLMPGGGYAEQRLSVEPGDALLLFTDGLLDAENAAGEAFGDERLEELIRSVAGGSVAEILARVEQALRDFRGPTEPGDDATIVALRVSAPAA